MLKLFSFLIVGHSLTQDINYELSSVCHLAGNGNGMGHVQDGLQAAINAGYGNTFYATGANIVCYCKKGATDGICAFFQNGVSGTVSDASRNVQELQNHNCVDCGSVATDGSSSVSNGELTLNYERLLTYGPVFNICPVVAEVQFLTRALTTFPLVVTTRRPTRTEMRSMSSSKEACKYNSMLRRTATHVAAASSTLKSMRMRLMVELAQRPLVPTLVNSLPEASASSWEVQLLGFVPWLAKWGHRVALLIVTVLCAGYSSESQHWKKDEEEWKLCLNLAVDSASRPSLLHYLV
nr:hypothetical protein CFP56_21224 [Quercus suber]